MKARSSRCTTNQGCDIIKTECLPGFIAQTLNYWKTFGTVSFIAKNGDEWVLIRTDVL